MTRFKVLAAVLFAALFFFGMQAPAAYAAPTAVTLKVSTKAGTALPGLNVYAYPVANHAVVGEGIVANLIGGKYVFSDSGDSHALDSAKNYAFYFDAPGSATTAFDQFWGGTTFIEEARYWAYASDTNNLDITLATNSTFTGKVTGLSNAALAGVAVYPWRFDGNGWFRLDDAKATTTSAGVYTMRNLEPGTYRLEFVPKNSTGYLSEFSGNRSTFASATALNVGLGATVSHNAVLAKGGSISGTVQLTDSTLGGNVQSYGITAFAYTVLPGGALDTDIPPYPSNETAANGAWSIKGLPTGNYKVKLYDTLDPNAPVFVDKWVGTGGGTTSVMDPATTTFAVVAPNAKTATKTTMPFYQDAVDTSLELNVRDKNGVLLTTDTEIYIVSNSGEDFSAHFLLTGGTTYFPFLPVGGYDIYVDPQDGINAPFIGTQTIANATANTWNINLTAISAFTYSVGASIANGSTDVGSTYTVNRGSTSLPDSKVEYSYIWLRDDAPIFGAQSRDSNVYTSRGVDVGLPISVIVRADAFGYAPVFSTVLATNFVTPGDAAGLITPPVISYSGIAAPGTVLTSSAGTWDTTGLTYSYQWSKNSGSGFAAIPGATQRSYTVQPGDALAQIDVTVTAAKPGHYASIVGSDPVTIAKLAAPKATAAPVIKIVGQKFTATPGIWSPVPSGFTYQWSADGAPVGSNSATYTCETPCTPVSAVALHIVATRTGYLDGVKDVVARKGTVAPTLSTPGFVYDLTDGGHPSFDTIADPAPIGHTLTVTAPVYSYPSSGGGTVSRTYQWQRLVGTTWTSISGATKVNYVPTATDLNKQLRVRMTTASSLYPSISATLIAGTGKYKQELVAGAKPTVAISGTDRVARTKLAIITGGWALSGVTQSYKWYSCPIASDCSDAFSPNWTVIAGATASSFVAPATLKDYDIAVQIAGSKSGYQTAVVRSAALALTDTSGNQVAMLNQGTIAGSAVVGKPVTVTAPVVDRSPVTRQYVWQVCIDTSCSGGHTIVATTALPTYTPTATDYAAGHYLRVESQATLAGGPTLKQLTSLVEMQLGTNVAISAPKITVAAGVYTVTSTWPVGSTVSYQWFDNGTLLSSTDTASPAPGTTPVSLTVQVSLPGYQPVVQTLSARRGTFSPLPTALTGPSSRYGDTFIAPALPTVTVGTVTAKYQWYSGTTTIAGKTAATFVPSTAYLGKALKVKVTLSSPFYNTVSYFSASVVLGSHLPATGTPLIVSPAAGNPPGSKLSANLSSFPPGMTYTYAWQRSSDGGTTWSAAATTSTYTVLATDVTKFVRVVVVAKRTGWVSSAALPSAAVGIGYSPALALTTPFVLVGSGKVDAPLTASTTWNMTGYALTYTWTRNGVTIPGATGPAVTPTASWYGDEVQAHVTANKAGHQPVIVHSNEVQIALGAAPTSSPLTMAPAIAKVSVKSTVASGPWSVAGVTLTYRWTTQADPGTVLSKLADYTPTSTAPLVVTITASRDGYAPGSVSRLIVPQP